MADRAREVAELVASIAVAAASIYTSIRALRALLRTLKNAK
jgi:hypothetical protein